MNKENKIKNIPPTTIIRKNTVISLNHLQKKTQDMAKDDLLKKMNNLPGTMSIRRLVKYTVVLRFWASLSNAVWGRIKWDTSAMWTPTWSVLVFLLIIQWWVWFSKELNDIFYSKKITQEGVNNEDALLFTHNTHPHKNGNYIWKLPNSCHKHVLTSKFPLGSSRQCKASSISVQPMGSTEQMSRCLKSSRSSSSCCQVEIFWIHNINTENKNNLLCYIINIRINHQHDTRRNSLLFS